MEEKSKNTKKATEQGTVQARFSAELIRKGEGKIETKTSLNGTTMDLLVLTYALVSNIAEQTGLTEEAVLVILNKVGTKLEKDTSAEDAAKQEKLKNIMRDFFNFLFEDKKEEN